VGADADVVIWDPEMTRVVRSSEQLTNADYSIYEGWEMTGWPWMTIRRGEVLFEDGAVTTGEQFGKFLASDRPRAEVGIAGWR
jgi:dihydropyrimidinase